MKYCIFTIVLCTFLCAIRAEKPIRVRTLPEFLAALQPGATILISPGGLDFSESKNSMPTSPYASHSPMASLYIHDLRDLKILGEGPARVRLSSANSSVGVVSFANCPRLSLTNLLITHDPSQIRPGAPSSDGSYGTGLTLAQIENLSIRNVEIGSGSVGLLMLGILGARVDQLDIHNAWQNALLIDAYPGPKPIPSHDLIFANLKLHDNPSSGSPVFIRDSNRITLVRPIFQRNIPTNWGVTPDNVLITTIGAHDVTVQNPQSLQNGFTLLRKDK
jgi:hypothetical protein